MQIHLDHPYVPFAIETVRQAVFLARDIQTELVSTSLSKEDKSPVTVTDFAVQALISCLLERAFPKSALVAEEDSSILRRAEFETVLRKVVRFVGRYAAYATPETVCAWIDRGGGEPKGGFWVLDPIDGTKGFLRGGHFAIALAYVEDGNVQLGVLGCPKLSANGKNAVSGEGAIAAAVRGAGAWSSPVSDSSARSPLRVSSCSVGREARVLRSVESSHTNEEKFEELLRALDVTLPPICMDSQSKSVVLASGHAELLFRLPSRQQPNYRECIWDQAAGALVVEEAGGRITDLYGRALDFSAGRRLNNNVGILASNGILHERALAVVQRIYGNA